MCALLRYDALEIDSTDVSFARGLECDLAIRSVAFETLFALHNDDMAPAWERVIGAVQRDDDQSVARDWSAFRAVCSDVRASLVFVRAHRAARLAELVVLGLAAPGMSRTVDLPTITIADGAAAFPFARALIDSREHGAILGCPRRARAASRSGAGARLGARTGCAMLPRDW